MKTHNQSKKLSYAREILSLIVKTPSQKNLGKERVKIFI